LSRLPPVDPDERAMFVDRVLPTALKLEQYVSGGYLPVAAFGRTPCTVEIHTEPDVVVLVCRPVTGESYEKRLQFTAGGILTVSYDWDALTFFPGGVFSPEISLAQPIDLGYSSDPDVWSFPITTLSKSERGFDETVQGQSITPRWPTSVGHARIELTPR
jgi:hypothetical protein